MTVLTACVCALLFCSCSVKSKGSLISYAKSEFGDCKFVSQEVTGSGNDTVRTVYLIDEDTGIEYTVTSSMVDMNIDGSSFGYVEQTSSDFTNLYIDYIHENASDELSDIEDEYKVEIEDNLGKILFEARPSEGQPEAVARAVDDVVSGYDVKDLLDITYLVYAEDGDAYLGVLDGATGEWNGNNVYEVIDYVQSVFPEAEYSASMYGLPESYIDYDDLNKLKKYGNLDMNNNNVEFFFFKEPSYGTIVACDLSEVGLEGYIVSEYENYSAGDTIACDLLGIEP